MIPLVLVAGAVALSGGGSSSSPKGSTALPKDCYHQSATAFICIPDQTGKLAENRQMVKLVADEVTPDYVVNPNVAPTDTALPAEPYLNGEMVMADPSTTNAAIDPSEGSDPIPGNPSQSVSYADGGPATLNPPTPGLNQPGGGGGGDVPADPGEYPAYCTTVGCWFWISSYKVEYTSSSIKFGFIGPDGDKYTAGSVSIATVYTLSGTGEKTMSINGYLLSNHTLHTLDFTGAMTNGSAGKHGGNWIGSKPCLSIGYEKNMSANAAHYPARNFPCVKSETSNHDHVGTMQFSWTSNDSNVPDGYYWFVYVRSTVAHSVNTGTSAYYKFDTFSATNHGFNTDFAVGGTGNADAGQEWSGIDTLSWFWGIK